MRCYSSGYSAADYTVIGALFAIATLTACAGDDAAQMTTLPVGEIASSESEGVTSTAPTSTTAAATTTTAAPTTTTTPPTTTTTVPSLEVVPLAEAGDRVGDTIVVCGEAYAQINRLDGTKQLNIEDEFNVWITDPTVASAVLERDGVDSYYGKSVCVQGEVLDPEGDGSFFGIVVDDMEQLELR